MPQRLKQKSQLFIESDVEGDWVHWIKWPWVDKGKGRMEMEDKDLDEAAARAQYWADICWIAWSNKSIACSFEALVVLLADWLPASGTEHPEVVGSEGEEEEGDVEIAEDGHV